MEHVISQWLSKLAQRYHDVCYQGVVDAKIPFCNLKFPACTECNSEFSKLESAAKHALVSVMESKPITGNQARILLDWFDKIRVGIWLSELILSKQLDEITPNFYIADRMGMKDRMLVIEQIGDKSTGLAYSGTGTRFFHDTPSAFQLIVNNWVFTNASEYGLVSGKLGFPYPQKMPLFGKKQPIEIDILKGRGKTASPVIPTQSPTPFKTLIYQPMFRDFVNEQVEKNPYHCDYVRNHSYDFANGVGGIFMQKNNNKMIYLGADESANLAPKPQPVQNLPNIVKQVYVLQNYMLDNLFTTKVTEPDVAAYYNALKATNDLRIKTLTR